jgi:hypothetical protein
LHRRLLVLCFGCLASAILVFNTATRPKATLDELRAPRRYWEDVTVGISHHLYRDAEEAATTVSVGSGPASDLRHAYTRHLIRTVEEEGIRPWQFWRTVRIKPYLKRERVVPRDFDDPGRPGLIAAGFRALGGVSPYLGLWLGALFCVPVLAWSAAELGAAGRLAAAAAFPLLLALSCFVVEVLALPYSAVGFYVLGVLVLACLAIYALLGRSTSTVGLLARLVAAGALFALCLLCRASTIALLPGFVLAIVLAMRRALAARGGTLLSWKGAGLALAGIAVFLLPYVAVRQPRHHAIWGDVWEGLGDFDRTKGHAWFDPALRRLLRSEGMRLHRNVGVEWESPESESILKHIVLREIAEDPLWYAEILVKRLGSTLSLSKLWPYGPSDGRTMTQALTENEGLMDSYYAMTTTVDFFGLGSWRREVRLGLLLAPSVLLATLWLAGFRPGPLFGHREALGRCVATLACVACGCLVLPVGITTASALETEAFAIVYFLGLALLLDQGLAFWRCPQ